MPVNYVLGVGDTVVEPLRQDERHLRPHGDPRGNLEVPEMGIVNVRA
jgi:hypothetical protein